ncbi:MAG TPA: BatA domain-containing protein [Candidatus Krumholzibacteria bacterium]|nr:BatA domain-containing protein [Candidatus Krumholzibacteria bacterium]
MGFLNIAFLFGLAAAAVPVIIHLLNRRRVKKIKFSSLEFLQEVNRQRMRRLNLKRFLILALRTLAVLMIVVAFARPTLRSGLLFAGSVPKNVVICLDASYSMGVNQETGTAFDAAKRIAKQIVDEAANNDEINVVVFAKTAEPVLDKGTRNRGVVKGAIDRATLTNQTTSLRSAVDRALALIGESDVKGGEIYVVSDFRYSTDSTLVDEKKTPDDVRIYFIPAYKGDADNVSIDRVAVPRKLLRAGEVVKVGVTATNYSRQTPANVSLELSVEGDRKAEQVLELAPGATQTVTFPLSLAKAGQYHARASKNHDRLPIDDDRYFLIEVSNSIPVTVVGGRQLPSGSSDTSAHPGFYVEKALNPRGTAEGEFTVTSVDEKDVTASSLPDNGVVVWVSPQEMEPRRMALLERHVRRGGGLMVFLGGASRMVLDDPMFRALTGIRGATEKEEQPQSAFTSFEKQHPVFNLFTRDELELLSRARVNSYVAARGVSPDSVIAYVGGGDPAAWECVRGRGRVLVLAASPDLATGDIPLSPMFLPLVHTSVTYLATSGEAPGAEEHLVGAPLEFTTGQRIPDESQLVVHDPSGTEEKPVVIDNPAGDPLVSVQDPTAVGFYRLYRDTTLVAQEAVNVDARESDLTSSSLPRKNPKAVSVVEAGQSFRSDLRQAKEGREVFAVFLMIAIAALVAESVLGRRA